jgi:hypothetical protein
MLCLSSLPAEEQRKLLNFFFAKRVVIDLCSFSQSVAFSSMERINAFVINITLDVHNYPEWSFCFETTLRGHGLFPHLSDDPPTPVADPSNSTAIQT